MSEKKTEETKITIICWNCDRKYSVMLGAIKKKQAIYLGEDDAELGKKLIWPKAYVVPCPNPECGAENEVRVP